MSDKNPKHPLKKKKVKAKINVGGMTYVSTKYFFKQLCR